MSKRVKAAIDISKEIDRDLMTEYEKAPSEMARIEALLIAILRTLKKK